MTVSPDFLLVQFSSPNPGSPGDLCLLSMLLRQGFFGELSHQLFSRRSTTLPSPRAYCFSQSGPLRYPQKAIQYPVASARSVQ